MTYPILKLKPGKTKSIFRRHPWIFSGALFPPPESLEEGQIVHVQDSNGNGLATGHYGKGSIAVRILSFKEVDINESWYSDKIKSAYELRKNSGLVESKDTNAYRLFHGEGDHVPGLVIDFYNGLAVVQAHHQGIENDFGFIKSALEEVLGASLRGVFLKTTYRAQNEDSVVDPVSLIKENGLNFEINAQTGQKTGFFLDQRENRSLIETYAASKKVLNVYCYSGGFSLYALRAKASEVHSLDSSKRAIELLERNLDLNGFGDEKHKSISEDAINYLNSDEAKEEKYDLIVLDPPAFAKSRGARHRAVQAYKRINARAMRILKPGGILFTFSCSQVVSTELFDHTVAAAAIETRREARILHRLHQPADHPVNVFHPEGNYLKGLVLKIS